MKTIGLLGGMSWESSSHYYQLLNRRIAVELGGLHSARLVMLSVDFHPLEELMRQNNWDEIANQLAAAALRLEGAGADFLLLCTNTMHTVADSILQAITIPFIHIADVTAERICAAGLQCVGLLGTRFTMEQSFYTDRLSSFGLRVIVPEEKERHRIDDIIFRELCRGEINKSSRESYLETIVNLKNSGAEGIILGCTEIGMLISQSDSPLPLFDTTHIHVDAAVHHAINR